MGAKLIILLFYGILELNCSKDRRYKALGEKKKEKKELFPIALQKSTSLSFSDAFKELTFQKSLGHGTMTAITFKELVWMKLQVTKIKRQQKSRLLWSYVQHFTVFRSISVTEIYGTAYFSILLLQP